MQGWRTYAVSLLPIIFGVLQMTDWNSFMNDPKAGMVGIGSGLLMAYMRTITTTPAGPSARPFLDADPDLDRPILRRRRK